MYMSPELLETLLRVCEKKGSGELSENDHSQSVSTVFHHDGSIPAARAIGDFAWERVGNDLVLFDAETMQYHTLNAVAERIWRACDGVASVASITASTGLPGEVVETTVSELGEASLLATPGGGWAVSMNRRRAAKLIAAGVVGAVGVPVVLSITAPDSASAQTQLRACGSGEHQTATGCSLGDKCRYQDWDDIQCCTYTGYNTTIWWSVGCSGI